MNLSRSASLYAVITLAIDFTGLAAHAASPITYTDIADTFIGSPNKQVLEFPSINNSGQVAFSSLSQSNVQYVYVTNGAGFTDVADTLNGFTGFNPPTLDNLGAATFAGTSSTGPNANHAGIFTGSGGAVTTVSDSNTGTTPYFGGQIPRGSDTGYTTFIGREPVGGNQAVILAKNGGFTTVVQNNGSQYEFLSDSAVNNSGQVVFNTDDYSTGHNNGAFVYRYTPGSGIVQMARAFTATSVAINDAGTVAYEGAVGNGNGFPPTGIFTNNGTTITAISQIGQALPGTSIVLSAYAANNEGTPINNIGQVALQGAGDSGANYGIYVGDGTTTLTIVQQGQILFGKIVSDFWLGRDSLNDSGQVAFRAAFTDGTYAIVRTGGTNSTLPTPEPSTVASVGLGGLGLFGLMFKARRRKQSL